MHINWLAPWRDHERLEGNKSLQWPVAPDGTDEPLLYTEEFASPDGKVSLFLISLSEATDSQRSNSTSI
jgi:formate dehydrogenase major subunit